MNCLKDADKQNILDNNSQSKLFDYAVQCELKIDKKDKIISIQDLVIKNNNDIIKNLEVTVDTHNEIVLEFKLASKKLEVILTKYEIKVKKLEEKIQNQKDIIGLRAKL